MVDTPAETLAVGGGAYLRGKRGVLLLEYGEEEWMLKASKLEKKKFFHYKYYKALGPKDKKLTQTKTIINPIRQGGQTGSLQAKSGPPAYCCMACKLRMLVQNFVTS